VDNKQETQDDNENGQPLPTIRLSDCVHQEDFLAFIEQESNREGLFGKYDSENKEVFKVWFATHLLSMQKVRGLIPTCKSMIDPQQIAGCRD